MSTLLLSTISHEFYWSGFVLCIAIMGLILLRDKEQRYWEPDDMTGLQHRVVFVDSNGDDLETHTIPIGDDPDGYAVAMMHRYPKFRDYYIVV